MKHINLLLLVILLSWSSNAYSQSAKSYTIESEGIMLMKLHHVKGAIYKFEMEKSDSIKISAARFKQVAAYLDSEIKKLKTNRINTCKKIHGKIIRKSKKVETVKICKYRDYARIVLQNMAQYYMLSRPLD